MQLIIVLSDIIYHSYKWLELLINHYMQTSAMQRILKWICIWF